MYSFTFAMIKMTKRVSGYLKAHKYIKISQSVWAVGVRPIVRMRELGLRRGGGYFLRDPSQYLREFRNLTIEFSYIVHARKVKMDYAMYVELFY